MKIEDNYNTTIKQINIGECFRTDGVIYMKTDEKNEDGGRRCVSVCSGYISYFMEDSLVAPVDIKAVVK